MSSEVKRYDAVHLRYEDSNIRYGEGCEVEVVTASDYAALEAECERLRSQVSALQSDANSWQSGYDKGREEGAKAAEGWKAQHARDSAELRRLCAERDQQWRLRRDAEADRDTANAVSSELRAERDALAAELAAIKGRLADALDRQSVITGDYIARCQRLADELAMTRRVIDRIAQLCTTPHESKERFTRRVQSVIEWERAAQQDQPQ